MGQVIASGAKLKVLRFVTGGRSFDTIGVSAFNNMNDFCRYGHCCYFYSNYWRMVPIEAKTNILRTSLRGPRFAKVTI